MFSIAELRKIPNGARFYRADLHIHSHHASHDVKDAKLTPDNIVATALAEGIEMIALTDHNEISNVGALIESAKGKNITIIAGVELSTPEGHLLCYLPDLEALQRFYGALTVEDNGTQKSRCTNSMHDCLNKLEQHGGLGIIAHVDTDNGLEAVGRGNSPHKMDILCHRALLGFEVLDVASPVTYSSTDADQDRSQVNKLRNERLGFGSKQSFARVLNSDAHKLLNVGKNGKGKSKVTRYKMNQPGFESFRIALLDADARVRIEDQIPDSVPFIAGIHMEGGFLESQSIHFSKNLNCIVGGRGTGKSTTFEGVRLLTGDASDKNVVDSEVWPNHLDLFWVDQAGQTHHLTRAIGEAVQNPSDPGGPTGFQIECYGQGETADISKDADENPLALLGYLDRFVDIAEDVIAENNARDELLDLHGRITDARRDIASIPDTDKALKTTQQQLEALKQVNAEEVIELQKKLEEERVLRGQIEEKMTEIEEGLANVSPEALIEELTTLAVAEKLSVGSVEFGNIVTKAKEFEECATEALEKAGEKFTSFKDEAGSEIAKWKKKEAQAIETIAKKERELAAQNIRLDMVFIKRLAKSEATLKVALGKLEKAKPLLTRLEKQSAAASTKRWAARSRIAIRRNAYARQASDTLRAALTDLSVSLKFGESTFAPDAERQIIEAMAWRTNQQQRAKLLIATLSMPGLLKAIDEKDYAAIEGVKDKDVEVFDRSDAKLLVEQLSEPAIRFALERCEIHDLPKLIVTKSVIDASGKSVPSQRDFSRLSLGQQQSVLLALMLSSSSNCPLIIDQPEDNLDSEFIYHSLVPVLRIAKERRQIIVVTHNANIAVLGDAEQIIVLKSSSEKGRIVARGSIDDTATKIVACNILEGASEAFKKRAQIYGEI